MEFLDSFLRRQFKGKPVVASSNVSCFLKLKKKYSVSSQDQTLSIELKILPIFVLILYFRKALHMHRPQMSHIFYFCEKV